MKRLLPVLVLLIVIACGSDDGDIVPIAETGSPNEALVVKGVPYGSESRQFVDIYKPASECPTPIYFDAHGNGGNTDMPDAIIQDLNAAGIAVIAWESLTSVNTPEEVETGWSDAELMFQWVIENAETYNFDVSNMVIGGSSRGSILSWKYGHAPNPSVKGLYMYNALPSSVWTLPDWWYAPDEVNVDSPPVFFVYKREPGSDTDPTDPDIHDPENGFTILEKYESLDIGDRAELVHSIGETDNTDRYQFLMDFALSVLDSECQ